MMRRLFFFSTVLLLLMSCQRNDICIQELPSTPKMHLKFFDAANPEIPKSISGFNVKALEKDSLYFKNSVNDTTALLPLRTDRDFTQYAFILQIDSSTVFVDTLNFQYTREKVYVSRACGYKVNFYQLNAENLPGVAHWIEQIVIPEPKQIINEKQPHVYIYF